ncbi:HAD family hydrolase [Jonesia quinghaiensis]|uniref:HAD family hydrolase n=1 Tax=Jonesia quinghaiensis TaxID=262806 RepID=UPI00040D055F|nr:HAD family hydrolase [Jonesia quinghaiensis]
MTTRHLPTPRALLLDFGGVIFLTSKNPAGKEAATAALLRHIHRAGHDIDPAALTASITAGQTALKHWKHASSRRLNPREMGHREIVGDFLAADLPAPIRATLESEARQVLHDINSALSHHTLRPGITDLLNTAAQHNVPVVIVSNAHSGANHRRLLRAHGIDKSFAAQIYSDEVGIRKPNPRMIELAAEAAGVAPADCWYVGDTLDRDVVTGRRAGTGAVFITASQHTANPPFAVTEQPDAIFDTPEGLVPVFHDALTNTTTQPGATTQQPAQASGNTTTSTNERRTTLFIDHGGVISTSHNDDALLTPFLRHLSEFLSTPTHPFTVWEAGVQLAQARETHKTWKQQRRLEHDATDAPLREIQPHEFWTTLFGAGLTTQQQALLRTEAHELTAAYGRAKSRRTQRPGIHELLTACFERNMPVVVVSNTISGRAVRAECQAIGLDGLISGYVCSDEIGIRKPDQRIINHAITLANANPATSWFVGDKPQNDAAVALAAGITHRVLLRGGTTEDDQLDAALESGLATHVVDSAHGVLDAMTSQHSQDRLLAHHL